MSNQEVAEAIIRQFGEAVSEFDEPFGLLTLTVSREQLLPLMTYLKDHKQYQINFLTDITGVHYPDDAGRESAWCITRIAWLIISGSG